MPDPAPNYSVISANTNDATSSKNASQFAGELLKDSGFENEVPDADFEWRD